MIIIILSFHSLSSSSSWLLELASSIQTRKKKFCICDDFVELCKTRDENDFHVDKGCHLKITSHKR